MKKVSLFVVLALAFGVFTGVSFAQDAVDSVCLVTDLGRVNDGTFNQFAHDGAIAVTDDFELDYSFIETESEADYDANIASCIEEGFDVVVTVGFLIQDATTAAAEANPDVYFVGIDQFLVDGPENYVGIQYREDQTAFLVGALAAMVANDADEDVIAGLFGVEIPGLKRFRNGYEQGALYVNPEWELGTNVLGVYASSFVDQAEGVSLAQQFLGDGAYVLFGAGGPMGSAGIAEASAQDVWVIGVDQDEYFTTFDRGEGVGSEYLISSALKRVDVGVYDMVALLAEGAFDEFPGGTNYILDVTNGGVGFAPKNDAPISDEFYDRIAVIEEMLISGELATGVDPVSGDLCSSLEEMSEACEAEMGMMEDMDMEEAEMEATEEAGG